MKAAKSSFNIYWQSAFAGGWLTDIEEKETSALEAKEWELEQCEPSRDKEALIHQLTLILSTEKRTIAILAV